MNPVYSEVSQDGASSFMMSAEGAGAGGEATPSDLHLQENLVGPSRGTTIPVAASTPVVEVTAPATLPEGYEFEASLGNNQTMKVIVPPGGVEQGQKFSVPLPGKLETMITGINIPVGHWRDELFDCFNYGVCHPHCWTSWLCWLLASGQVITRLKFTWYGSPASTPQESVGAFQYILYATIFYFTTHFGLYFMLVIMYPDYFVDENQQRHQSEGGFYDMYEPEPAPPTASASIVIFLYETLHWVYVIAGIVLLTNLRRNVRTKYGIPAPDLEDCCCSTFCHCCTAAQLLRHTTDYDVYPGKLCTNTGLPPHAPSIV